MAQKTNPISLRLQHTNRFFDNNWYSKKYYDKLVVKDIHIQKYINTFLKVLKLPSSRVSIQHIPQKTRMFSFFCYPKLSRTVRSKMFGVSIPHYFKQQNKWVARNKKYNSTTKFSFKNKKSSSTKVLSSPDLFNNSLVNLVGIPNTYSSGKKLVLKNFSGKNEKWAKNLFFVTPFMKAGRDTYSLKSTGSQLVEHKNKTSLQEHSHKLFLKFILNLVMHTKYKAQKTNIQNVKVQPIDTKSFLKYFLLMNTFQKNILNSPTLTRPLATQFMDTSSLKSMYNKRNSFPRQNESLGLTTIQDILEIFPQKESSGATTTVVSNPLFLHGVYSFEKGQVLKIDNKWKLETLENKFKYKNYIQRSLAGVYNLDFEWIPFKIKHDWQSAGFLADEIAYFLERRVPFRRFKNKLLNYISKNSNIRGIRITCSGRVGGKSKKAQRAKTECVKLGQTSLHVFSNQIDFAIRTAHTSFGSVGIKVWISYNS